VVPTFPKIVPMDLWVVKDTSRRFRMRDVSGPQPSEGMLSISRPIEVIVL
jgi:hypothetical protein